MLELAGDVPGRMRLWKRVAERLRGPLHEPAVREALGCLIPEWLDPRLDNKKPKGKTGWVRGADGCALGGRHLESGRWSGASARGQ